LAKTLPVGPQPTPLGRISRAVTDLRIYNLKGELARVLEAKTLGWNELNWDGCDQRGQHLPSGIYLLQIKSGMLSQARKVVLKR